MTVLKLIAVGNILKKYKLQIIIIFSAAFFMIGTNVEFSLRMVKMQAKR